MLLKQSADYLKSVGKSVSDLPQKFRDIFASMEEYQAEYQQLPAGERAPFDNFIQETDEEVLGALKSEIKPSASIDIQTIIKERRIDDESLKALNEHIKAQKQTQDKFKKNGKYTKSRQALHDKIIKGYLDEAKCIVRDKPIAIMTGGLPGSGKSTFINKNANWINNPAIFKIDADEVRAKLPEYEGWNSAVVHEETGDIVNRLLEKIGGKGCKYDVVYDGTMVNSRKYNALMDKLKEEGYDVYLIYVKVPLETSIERAMGRYQRSGRYVPLDVIRGTASRGTEVFDELKKKAKGWVEFDSIAQKITGKGGAELPDDRDYTKLTELCENGGCKEDDKPAAPTADYLKKKIKAFETALRLEDDEARKKYLSRKIKAYKIAAAV